MRQVTVKYDAGKRSSFVLYADRKYHGHHTAAQFANDQDMTKAKAWVAANPKLSLKA